MMTMEIDEPEAGPELTKWNWRRNILAIALGLSIFPLVELFLIVFGLNPSIGRNMGNFGIEGKVPLFDKIKDGAHTYWCPSRKWFGGMRYYETDIKRYFEMPKQSSTFRIFTVGGSSAAGYPFGPRTAFSRWLEIMLNALGTSRNYEVINLGINGISSYEVKQLYPQILKADPDLIVVYVGHNDCMLEKSYSGNIGLDGLALRLNYGLLNFRLYRLLFKAYHELNSEKRKDTFLYYANLRKMGKRPERDEYFYPLEARKKVKEKFARNLDAIVNLTEKAGVPLILCTVVYNVLDTAPEGSVHGKKLNPQELEQWERDYQTGKGFYKAGKFKEALEYFQSAAALDDGYAMLRYKMGRSLIGLGRVKDGERELRTAVEMSDLPVRAQSFINPAIREESRKPLVFLADVQAALKMANQGRAPGNDWFLDRMHPNIDGHQLIAKTILQAMVDNYFIVAGKESLARAELEIDDYEKNLDPEFLFENYFYLATEKEYLGRIKRAIRLSNKALEYKPDDRFTEIMMVQRLKSIYGNVDTYE